MLIDKLFNKLPHVLTAIFLAVGFYLLARTINGYTESQQHLIILADLAMSVGLFTLVIPVLTLLLDQPTHKIRFSKLKLFSILLLTMTLSSVWLLVFKTQIADYFGLEQAPKDYFLPFLFLLLAAITTSLLYLFIAMRNLPALQISKNWPLIFYFAACGVGLSLVSLLTIKAQGSVEIIDATLVLSEFLRRLILVGAIGQVFIKILETTKAPPIYSSICLAGCTFLLMGFQDTSLSSSGNELFFTLNQFLQLSGLSLIFITALKVLIKSWQKHTPEILFSGAWVVHGLFLASLLLMIISNGSFGFFRINNLVQDFQYLILVLAIPLLANTILQKKNSLQNKIMTYLTLTLSWSGIFVCLITGIALASHGANLVSSQTLAFKPLFSLLVGGLFMLVISQLISLWNHILHDVI